MVSQNAPLDLTFGSKSISYFETLYCKRAELGNAVLIGPTALLHLTLSDLEKSSSRSFIFKLIL